MSCRVCPCAEFEGKRFRSKVCKQCGHKAAEHGIDSLMDSSVEEAPPANTSPSGKGDGAPAPAAPGVGGAGQVQYLSPQQVTGKGTRRTRRATMTHVSPRSPSASPRMSPLNRVALPQPTPTAAPDGAISPRLVAARAAVHSSIREQASLRTKAVTADPSTHAFDAILRRATIASGPMPVMPDMAPKAKKKVRRSVSQKFRRKPPPDLTPSSQPARPLTPTEQHLSALLGYVLQCLSTNPHIVRPFVDQVVHDMCLQPPAKESVHMLLLERMVERTTGVLDDLKRTRNIVLVQAVVRCWKARAAYLRILPTFRRVRDRLSTLNELIRTERTFVQQLEVLSLRYHEPLAKLVMSDKKGTMSTTTKELEVIFGNCHGIWGLSQSFLQQLVHKRDTEWPDVQGIGKTFLGVLELVRIEFETYARMAPFGRFQLQWASEDEKVQIFLQQTRFEVQRDGLTTQPLQLLLSRPMQRIGAYVSYLGDLLAQTPADHADMPDLKAALKKAREVLVGVRDAESVGMTKARSHQVERELSGSDEKTIARLCEHLDVALYSGCTVVEHKKKYSRLMFLVPGAILLAKMDGRRLKIRKRLELDAVKCAALVDGNARKNAIQVNDKMVLFKTKATRDACFEAIDYAQKKLRMRDKVFGAHLATVLKREKRTQVGVPNVVEKCVKYFEDQPELFATDGLFRITAATEDVEDLSSLIDRDHRATYDLQKLGRGPHEVATILKLYFRELSDPLIPYDSFDDFVAASQQYPLPDDPTFVAELSRLVGEMPMCNQLLLVYLVQFLRRVASYSDVNRMAANNLAIVFGPTLIRPRVETIELAMLFDVVNRIVEHMIRRCDDIFPAALLAPASESMHSGDSVSSLSSSLVDQLSVRKKSLSNSTGNKGGSIQHKVRTASDPKPDNEATEPGNPVTMAPTNTPTAAQVSDAGVTVPNEDVHDDGDDKDEDDVEEEEEEEEEEGDDDDGEEEEDGEEDGGHGHTDGGTSGARPPFVASACPALVVTDADSDAVTSAAEAPPGGIGDVRVSMNAMHSSSSPPLSSDSDDDDESGISSGVESDQTASLLRVDSEEADLVTRVLSSSMPFISSVTRSSPGSSSPGSVSKDAANVSDALPEPPLQAMVSPREPERDTVAPHAEPVTEIASPSPSDSMGSDGKDGPKQGGASLAGLMFNGERSGAECDDDGDTRSRLDTESDTSDFSSDVSSDISSGVVVADDDEDLVPLDDARFQHLDSLTPSLAGSGSDRAYEPDNTDGLVMDTVPVGEGDGEMCEQTVGEAEASRSEGEAGSG